MMQTSQYESPKPGGTIQCRPAFCGNTAMLANEEPGFHRFSHLALQGRRGASEKFIKKIVKKIDKYGDLV